MNKKQEKIAIELIEFIKDNSGFVTQIDLSNSEISKKVSFQDEFTIFGGLQDLKLIKKEQKTAYRLTNKGWKFKSFKKLYCEEKLKLIGTKTVIITAIVTVIINLLQILL